MTDFDGLGSMRFERKGIFGGKLGWIGPSLESQSQGARTKSKERRHHTRPAGFKVWKFNMQVVVQLVTKLF